MARGPTDELEVTRAPLSFFTVALHEMLPQHLLEEDGLYSGFYVDCTFGRGGHSRQLLAKLSSSARLLAFDVDPEAARLARELEKEDSRFRFVHRAFSELEEELGEERIDGIMLDLGSCKDDRSRGFLFDSDDALDLRFNPYVGIPAWKWLRQVSKEELAWVIREYGEEEGTVAERIAEALKLRIREGAIPIHSSKYIAEIVRDAKGGYDERGQHPAKPFMHAVRTFINREFEELEAVLPAAFRQMVRGARCIAISSRRRESAAIQKFIHDHEEPNMELLGMNLRQARLVELYPLLGTCKDFSVRLPRDPVRPRDRETAENPKVRSAMAYILVKGLRDVAMEVDGREGARPLEERFRKPEVLPDFGGAGGAESNSTISSSSTDQVAAAPETADAWVLLRKPCLPSWVEKQLATEVIESADVKAPESGESVSDVQLETSAAERSRLAEGDAKDEDENPEILAQCQVLTDFFCKEDSGYLSAQTGQVLHILYRGSEETGDIGWLFCALPGGSEGWFEASNVKELAVQQSQ